MGRHTLHLVPPKLDSVTFHWRQPPLGPQASFLPFKVLGVQGQKTVEWNFHVSGKTEALFSEPGSAAPSCSICRLSDLGTEAWSQVRGLEAITIGLFLKEPQA